MIFGGIGAAALGLGAAITTMQIDETLEYWLRGGNKQESGGTEGPLSGLVPDLSLTTIVAAGAVGFSVYKLASWGSNG